MKLDDVVIQVIDFGSQGDNVASLNFLLTCKYDALLVSLALHSSLLNARVALVANLFDELLRLIAQFIHSYSFLRYSLYVIVWKRPDTLEPLSEQQLMPLISWVRAVAAMAPSASFLIVATHSNTPRPAESHDAYKASFESMLNDVKVRIKAELDRMQESYNAELAELHRTIEKLKAQLIAQEIKKRKLGTP